MIDVMNLICEQCGECFESAGARGRTPTFCSAACKQKAYRARRAGVKRLQALSVGRWVRAVGKRPVMVDGSAASSANPATWASFAEVQSGAGDGFGVMMGGGVACLDLDNALDDGGGLKPWARLAVESLPCPVIYSEVSLSGRGVHVFVEAPEGRGSSRVVGDGRVEWFPSGRFIRCTFNEFKL